MPFENKLPSTGIKTLLVDKNVIENPKQALQSIVFEDSVTSFQRDFLIETGVVLEFTARAKKQLAEKASEGLDVAGFLEESFKDYGYGLKLIGDADFKVTSEVIKNPKDHLDKLIKKTYKAKKS